MSTFLPKYIIRKFKNYKLKKTKLYKTNKWYNKTKNLKYCKKYTKTLKPFFLNK